MQTPQCPLASWRWERRTQALGQASSYVSSTRAGVVTALVDRGGGSPVEACTLLSGLNNPNGVAYDPSTGSLYVAEVTAITRHAGADEAALAGCDASLLRSTQVVVPGVLPIQSGHANRFLGIGPRDGLLYVTVALPGNVDVCEDPYCTIHRMGKDGSNVEVFARGIRNAAGWDRHPASGALLFAAMERDRMGNDLPDDFLGVADKPGMDFTFRYCHWEGEGPPELRLPGPVRALPDPQFTLPGVAAPGMGRPSDEALAQRCLEVAPTPLQVLGPHVAPLGVLYWPPPNAAPAAADGSSNSSSSSTQGQQQQWPAEYAGAVFVAQHGSWNRDTPIGYRVAAVKLSPDGRIVLGHQLFAEGLLGSDGEAWGRPVRLLRLPDGSMLLGDDMANVVYRISYDPSTPPAPLPAPAGSGSSSGAGSGGRSASVAALVVALAAVAAAAALLP